MPRDELCDGLDNDCDGVGDDGNPEAGQSCDTGLLGACAAGVEACREGKLVCLSVFASADEICDGVDNDCDGTVDEQSVPTGECDTGLLGACSTGTLACVHGSPECVQHETAAREVCDGTDNDCDGEVDEGNPEGGDSCDTGLEGVCSAGKVLCSHGEVVCAERVDASDEACNELDDDCDGHVDEGCCTHSVCESGNGLSADCGSCAARVCDRDPYCCEFEWDNLCIGRVLDACDNPGCVPPGDCIHALCVEGGALSPTCDPSGCVAQICSVSESCCSAIWSRACVALVEDVCAGDCSFR